MANYIGVAQTVYFKAYNQETGALVSNDEAQMTAEIAINTNTSVPSTNAIAAMDSGQPGKYSLFVTSGEKTGAATSISITSTTPNVVVESISIYAVPGNTSGIDSNQVQIDGDATAAENNQKQWNGTGLLGDTFPFRQDQGSSIGGGTSGLRNYTSVNDNVLAPILTIPFVGVQTSGTFLDTQGVIGQEHVLDDDGGGNIDIVYQINVTGNRTGDIIDFSVNLDSNVNDGLIQVYNFQTTTWEGKYILDGAGGTTFTTDSFLLLPAHTGTGAELGNVYVRFTMTAQTNPTLTVFSLFCGAGANITAIGYGSGYITMDTNNGVSGTGEGVGTIDNPSNNMPDARTISENLNFKQFNVRAASLIVLDQDYVGFKFFGFSYSLDLNSKHIAGSSFESCQVVGNDDGVANGNVVSLFTQCQFLGNSLSRTTITNCGLQGTIGLTEAASYDVVDSISRPLGGTDPTWDFANSPGATELNIRRYSGAQTFASIGANGADKVVIEGFGRVTLLNSCIGGTASLRGHFEQDNQGAATVVIETANYDSDVEIGDVQKILGTQLSETVSGRLADNTSTFWDNAGNLTTEIVDNIDTGNIKQVLGTAIVESTPGRFAGNWDFFFNNNNLQTTKTVDDVGGGGGGSGDISSILGTPITESSPGRIANNWDFFFNNNDSQTLKVVDNVGTSVTVGPTRFYLVSRTLTASTEVGNVLNTGDRANGLDWTVVPSINNSGEYATMDFTMDPISTVAETLTIDFGLDAGGNRNVQLQVEDQTNPGTWINLVTINNTGGSVSTHNLILEPKDSDPATGLVRLRYFSTNINANDLIICSYTTAIGETDLGSVPSAAEIAIEVDLLQSANHGNGSWLGDVVSSTFISTVTSQTELNLSLGPIDDNLYNGFLIAIRSQTTGSIGYGYITNYIGVSRTIFLFSPLPFTVAVGDPCNIIANFPSVVAAYEDSDGGIHQYTPEAAQNIINYFNNDGQISARFLDETATKSDVTDSTSLIIGQGGAGPWGTADTSLLALESSVQSVLTTGGSGPWTSADTSLLALEATSQSILSTGGTGPWTTASVVGLALEATSQSILTTGGSGPWTTGAGTSTLTAQQVWEYVTRELTSAANITSDGAAIATTAGKINSVLVTEAISGTISTLDGLDTKLTNDHGAGSWEGATAAATAKEIMEYDLAGSDGAAPKNSLYTSIMAGLHSSTTATPNKLTIFQTDDLSVHAQFSLVTETDPDGINKVSN
jgi:hypothetical protein